MLNTAIELFGTKQLVALLAGSIVVSLGVMGLASLVALTRRPAGDRLKVGHILLAGFSAILLAGGELAILGAGLVYPLRRIQSLSMQNIEEARHLNKGLYDKYIRGLLNGLMYQNPKELTRYAYKVYSPDADDGILAEIYHHIGLTNRYFVGFGAGNGINGNTSLLVRQGWNGFWIDGDDDLVNQVRDHFRPEIESKNLTLMQSFITAENIEKLFAQSKVPEEFDLMSVDLDRNA
jgi:hypothetical protein